MTRMPHACVDMRGFSWRLLPLERKLAWERDACRSRLAQALAAIGAAQRQLRSLEELRDEHAAAAAATIRNAPDPRTHANLLDYLASVQERLRRATGRLHQLEQALGLVRAECGECEKRLEMLLAARAAAMRTYIRAGVLREDRQADAAWLAHAQSSRSARGAAS